MKFKIKREFKKNTGREFVFWDRNEVEYSDSEEEEIEIHLRDPEPIFFVQLKPLSIEVYTYSSCATADIFIPLEDDAIEIHERDLGL